MPSGGSSGQVLKKASGADYDTQWADESGGSGGTNTVLNGSGAPSGATGADGDFYIDTASEAIYGPKAAGVWGSATSLVGPAGGQGPAGADGQDGADGAQGPVGPAGADGTDGADGADGRTVLSGSGAPGGGLGSDGDFYIDTTGNDLYGPKSGGAWGSATSLVGPTGPQGPAGADGDDGVQGTPGADGSIAIWQGGALGSQGGIDVSSFDGLIGLDGAGNTVEVDTLAEIEARVPGLTAGVRQVEYEEVSASTYTAVAADAGKTKGLNHATSHAMTLPATGLPAGFTVNGLKSGAGTTTVGVPSGATLNGVDGGQCEIPEQFRDVFTAFQPAVGTWIIVGGVTEVA
ncbi:MAG: hypothetical protein ACPHCN_17225 [Mycobacterium sp.]